MIRVKTSLDHKSIRRLIWLILTLFVLLGYSLQSAAGSAYYSLVMQDYSMVSTPPVILQNGTAGTSTIYANNTSAKVSVAAPLFDYVDNNDADVDSSADKGMHSNFPAQQAGPDSTYDTLEEENTEAIEDYVDSISDVDNSSEVGTHSNFENQKYYDSIYDTLTEQNTGVGEITKVGTDTSGTGNNLTLSFSHNLVSGTARIVIVSIGVENGNTTDVSTVTYGGVTMTLAVEGITGTSGFRYLCEIWYILENDLPSDGSQTVEITCSGTPYELEVNGFCSEYTGVTQGAPEATAERHQTNGTTITTDISPSDNAWVISAVGAGNSDGSFTHGQGQVEVLDFQDFSSTFAVAELRGGNGETSLDSTYSGTVNRLERVAASWTEATEDDNYELDLEIQFTAVIDFLPTETLCVITGTFSGTEDINVDFWNGTGWENLATDLTPYSCNEYTVSLTSGNFTIRFKGGTESSDTTQDQWQIDASFLRVEGAGSKEDAVDQQSNIDGLADIGTHSSFSAQQAGPDSVYDALIEEDASGSGSIIYENSVESNSTTGQSSHNFNYSLQKGSGNDRLVVLTVSWEDATGYASISSLTFGGTAMTHIVNVTVGPVDYYSEYISLWYLLDSSLPSSPGSYNIAVNVSEPIAREIYMAVAEYSGVKQSPPDDYDTHANTSAGNTVITLTAAADGSVVVAGVGEGGTNVLTNTNNIANLEEEVFSSCGSALGHHINVDSGDTTVGWNSLAAREGMAGAVWQPATWVSNYELDLEVQWTDVPYSLPNEELCIYGGTTGVEDIKVDVWNGSSWENIVSDLNASAWNNVTVTSYLTSSNFTIRFKGGNETGDTSEDTWQVDVALIHIWDEGGEDYELDLEVQWTNTDYTRTNEELCIKAGTFSGSESIQVKVWNSTGSSWHWVMNLTASQWNNVSITPYLISSTFTVQFLGGTETGDTSEDRWNIDAALLHVWTIGTYDYILRVNNTVTDSWQVRLKKYSYSNINRLQNCTIYFHNSTDGTSNQIIIENGSYINQTGPWYDLGDSETIYIAMTVKANGAAISYVCAYLEIRTPNTTTYAQYVITFEIT